MPKYLIQASYTQQEFKAWWETRRQAGDVQAAVRAVGEKVEAFYNALGPDDAIMILELPNNVTAAAVGLTTSGSGAVRVRTTPLLTAEEVDKAPEVKMQHRAPGQ